MAKSDLQLLLFGVAGEADYFHPIPESGLHRVENVCGSHENHVRQIKRDPEIVVAKSIVLLRIQNFQKRGRRVATKIRSHLINLIEHDQWIVCTRLLQRLDDAAGHRADVSPAMATDLSLVVHASQTESHELSAQRPRH